VTLVLDASGILAAISAGERRHVEARAALLSAPPPLVLSPFVLAEVDYLLARGESVDVELDFLADVAAGAYDVAPFSSADVAAAARVIERHRDLGIGLADASLVVLAERHGTRRILTLDERNFRALRASDGSAFVLVPADD